MPDPELMPLLRRAGYLMLLYNVRPENIRRRLTRVALRFAIPIAVDPRYRSITITGPDGWHSHDTIDALRINMALTAKVRSILEEVATGRLRCSQAMARLESIESRAPQHPISMVAPCFAIGAGALAWIIGADPGGQLLAGLAAGTGLLGRHVLAPFHPRPVFPPFFAALVGSLIVAAGIHLEATESPGLALVAPALMLIPGTHLINAVLNLVENDLPAFWARLGLSLGILAAATLGLAIAAELVLGGVPPLAPDAASPPGFVGDFALAGVAAAAFALSFNCPWRTLWLPALCGMIGHSIRFLATSNGLSAGPATFLAGLAVGSVAAAAGSRVRQPFATVAFAGAVTMMPGTILYQGVVGTLAVAAGAPGADPALLVSHLVRASWIVGAMGLGLIIGARLEQAFDPLRNRD